MFIFWVLMFVIGFSESRVFFCLFVQYSPSEMGLSYFWVVCLFGEKLRKLQILK